MGRKKSENEFFPEMNEILEGMQELMCDEDGNPLSPDHPQYKKFTGLMDSWKTSPTARNAKIKGILPTLGIKEQRSLCTRFYPLIFFVFLTCHIGKDTFSWY